MNRINCFALLFFLPAESGATEPAITSGESNVHMTPWIDLVVVFGSGCILGGATTAFWYKARLDVYKRLAEKHLELLNVPLAPADAHRVRQAASVAIGVGAGGKED